MLRAVLLSLCFANFAHAQNPPGYTTLFNAAKSRGVPLVIFFQCEGREIAGVEAMEASRFPDAVGPQIIVGDPKTLKCFRLKPTATDAEILACFPSVTKAAPVYREYFPEKIVTEPAPPTRPTYTGPPAYYSPAPLSLSGGFQLGPVGAYGSFGAGGYCVGST